MMLATPYHADYAYLVLLGVVGVVAVWSWMGGRKR